MSYAGPDNVYDDVDPDDAIAMEEARFNASLKGAKERETVLKAIHRANELQREIAGETPGLILHYLRDMQIQAIEAMATLISDKTMTAEQITTARLHIQPYAHLMGWMKDYVATARGARFDLEDLDRHLDGQVED